MRRAAMSLLFALAAIGCSNGFTAPSRPANQVAERVTVQTLFPADPVTGATGISIGVAPRRGVYTVNLKVRESGDFPIVANLAAVVGVLMSGAATRTINSLQLTLHGGANTFSIADPVGEATFINIFNYASSAISIESYSVLFDPS